MFNLLRIISWVALCGLSLMVIAGAYLLREQAFDEIYVRVNSSNTMLARGYVNSLWTPRSEFLLPLFLGDPGKLKDSDDVQKFARDTLNYFKGVSIIRANIYGPNLNLLLTVDVGAGVKFPPNTATPDIGYVRQQMKDKKNNSRLFEMSLDEMKRNVVQSVEVIKGTEGVVEGAVEIVTDVDDSAKRIEKMILMGTAGLLAAFIILILLSHIRTKRAESIISKQYEENAALSAQAATAIEETQQKSQFLANISHELRTPLNAIIGFSDVLRNEYVPPEGMDKHKDFINDIHASGSHLLSLINDILDFSKAEAGKLDIEVSEVNAGKLVQNCLRLVTPRAQTGNVRLIDSLPKTHMIMFTDGKRFKQILLNLLSNSVKFTPPDGMVRVSAWVDLESDMCVFEVKDTGIGIAPKDIPKAMSPFGQIDSALSRKYDGTGLGLPLAKKFVELMGGKFAIESEVGKGTTITFSLPREVKERDGIIVKTLN